MFLQNILIEQPGPEWWIKISDFGIAKRRERGTALRSLSGTLEFLAPEIRIQAGLLDVEDFPIRREYGFEVDIWATGEIIHRALCAQSPFPRSVASYVNRKS